MPFKTGSEDSILGEVVVEKEPIVAVSVSDHFVSHFEREAVKEKIDISSSDVEYVVNKMGNRSLEDAKQILAEALEHHKDDPNFSWETRETMKTLLEAPQEYQGTPDEYEFDVRLEAALIADWSPYPEVRAVTTMGDDYEERCESLRVYIIGLFYALAGSVIDTFFFNRFPSIGLSSLALQLLIAPTGQLTEYLPKWSFSIWGVPFSMNPGVWTFKEQMLCTLMMSSAAGTPYSAYVIVSQYSPVFFGFDFAKKFGFQIILTLSSQMMGFGVAGLCRVFLTYPVKCMWYGVLPTIALNRSLTQKEKKENINGWTLSRYPFFWIFFLVSFLWYWVPDFLFGALSNFNWMTWISPGNTNLAAVTGSFKSLGLNPIPTFDWNVIGGSGMVTPLWATHNYWIGLIISFFAILIIWYTNSRWTGYLPINSNLLYSNTGEPYSVRHVLNNRLELDETKYQAYSPPFYGAGNLVNYGSFFLLYPASFVYALLEYWRPIVTGIKALARSLRNPRKTLETFNDPFTLYVKKHCKEVPEWWFMVILLLSIVFAIISVKCYPDTQTPVWVIFFGLGINIIFVIPFGILYSITNTMWDVNVIVELILGYALPGNGNALMIGKCYATNFLSQADNYVTNQKQALYTRIPPRSLFRVQVLAVIICSFVQVAIVNFQVTGGIEDYCSPDQKQKFICQSTRTFFNSAVVWGVIGPERIFNRIYPAMKYCFLIGAFLPLPFWLLKLKWPKIGEKVNILLIIGGCVSWGSSNLSYNTGNLYIAWLFNGYIQRKLLPWWQKYNYLLYTALSSGLAWSAFIMFWSTSYKHIASVDWWGNNVMYEGCDYAGCSLFNATLDAPEGYFGPRKGAF